ncbi:MAG: hypothetical protein CL908_23115 [Deltaproteobacteria bacterium]|nr:hypothetical protein [Deltaproteobacteria bacterium]
MHPALAVLLGLIVALVLARTKIPMGIGFVLGGVAMAVSTGIGFGPTVDAVGGVLSSGSTWVFATQVTLVFVLSTVLKLAGSLDVLVVGAGALIRNRRLRLASLPALVGLLPMPGGAVVSAPLVDRTRCDVDLGNRDKNLINYWFRHVWEVCWPLYPPLLLAATFLPDQDMSKLVAGQFPLMIVLIAVGWWFILRRIPGGRDSLTAERPATGALARALMPLIAVIVAMPIFGAGLRRVIDPSLAGGYALVAALLVGLLVALTREGLGLLPRALREKTVWDLLVLAIGVKVFGGIVGETDAARATADLIRDGGLPPLVAIAALPLFVGFVSGATIAVVTVSFPMIVALVGNNDVTGGVLLPYLVLGYAMGFIGYMLSPVHMCLVLSSKFFDERVTGAYTRLVAPLLVFFVGAGVVYVSLTTLLG